MTLPRLPALFAFYGTLRRGGGALQRLGLDGLEWRGACRIPGDLYAVSWYPALVTGEGAVTGDVFTIEDAATIEVLDHFEGFDPDDPAGSLYLRQRLRLIEPIVDAWVYQWNGPTAGLDLVSTGDWLAHLRSR